MSHKNTNLRKMKRKSSHLWKTESSGRFKFIRLRSQITTRYNQNMQKKCRWDGAAQERIECCSCHLRTGKFGYNSHILTKIGQKMIGKTLPGYISVSAATFRWSEFGVNSTEAWIRPACNSGSGCCYQGADLLWLKQWKSSVPFSFKPGLE